MCLMQRANPLALKSYFAGFFLLFTVIFFLFLHRFIFLSLVQRSFACSCTLVGIELGWLKGCRSKQVFFTWSPIVFQDNLRKKDDRIEELEEALRESVQITAEREMVLAQEESARINAEKQVWNLIKSLVVLLGNSKLLFPLLYCET